MLTTTSQLLDFVTTNSSITKYSTKTTPEVFGLKPDMLCVVVNPPENYSQIMSNWQFNYAKKDELLDFAHLFTTKKSELESELINLKQRLKPNGKIWVSWLKKSSGLPTEIDENDIRNFALSIGLVDVKVCAVSDIWSGLKLVIPVSQR